MTRQIDEVMTAGPTRDAAVMRLRAEVETEYPGWTLDTVKIERNGAAHGLPIRDGFEWAVWGTISRPLDDEEELDA